jgi:predicted TIM-barrel fold metal-dependent hydrolase
MKRWGEKVPQVKWDPLEKEDAWYFAGERLSTAAGAAHAGWHEHPPEHPRIWSDVPAHAWKAEERLRKMDQDGVYAQILYPNVAGFGAGKYLGLRDPELMLLCVQAYNDWVVEWASASPRRLIPQMALPFWDLGATIKEMDRATKLGHKGIIFGGEPEYFGQPKLSSPHWDPMWAAAQERGLPINFHIGAGSPDNNTLIDASVGKFSAFSSLPVLFTLDNVKCLTQIIIGGVCHRFPRLNFVSVESGVGWLPFAMDMMDWMWRNCGVEKEHPEYKMLPSDYFKRQIYGCFWFERRTLDSAIEHLGPDNLLYESDFPHPTSMSPGPCSIAVSPDQYIQEVIGKQPRNVAEKLLHGNAARIYHLD